jgi:hypothetical protein
MDPAHRSRRQRSLLLAGLGMLPDSFLLKKTENPLQDSVAAFLTL